LRGPLGKSSGGIAQGSLLGIERYSAFCQPQRDLVTMVTLLALYDALIVSQQQRTSKVVVFESTCHSMHFARRRAPSLSGLTPR
jgi:hypothetical protein